MVWWQILILKNYKFLFKIFLFIFFSFSSLSGTCMHIFCSCPTVFGILTNFFSHCFLCFLVSEDSVDTVSNTETHSLPVHNHLKIRSEVVFFHPTPTFLIFTIYFDTIFRIFIACLYCTTVFPCIWFILLLLGEIFKKKRSSPHGQKKRLKGKYLGASSKMTECSLFISKANHSIPQ